MLFILNLHNKQVEANGVETNLSVYEFPTQNALI